MNKKMMETLSKYNFTYEGNTGYGEIDGYEVNVINNPTALGPVFFFSTYLSLEKKNLFSSKMQNKKIKMLQAGYFNYGVFVMIGAMTYGQFAKIFDGVMEQILKTLEEIEAPKKDICPATGEELDEVNYDTIYLPDIMAKVRMKQGSADLINEEIKKSNEEFKNAPNNYLAGFFGILIGGLVGVAITFILSMLGFIASLSSIVSILLGTTLYKKFGGKPNAVMIVMSIVTTLLMITGFIFYIYLKTANNITIENNMDLTGFAAFKYCMENADGFSRSFISDMGLNVLFIAIGGGISAVDLAKSIKRPKEIK